MNGQASRWQRWGRDTLLALAVIGFAFIFFVLIAPAFGQTPGQKDCPNSQEYCIIYNQEVVHVYVGDWHEIILEPRHTSDWTNVVYDVELMYFPYVKGGRLSSAKVPDGKSFRFRLEEPGMFYIRFRACGELNGDSHCSPWTNGTIPSGADPDLYPNGYVIYGKPKPVSGGGIS